MWSWLIHRWSRRARLTRMAKVLVKEALYITRECVRKHFKTEDVDAADAAAAQVMAASAYLALCMKCAEEMDLGDLAELTEECFAALDTKLHAHGADLDALKTTRVIVKKNCESVTDEAQRDRLVSCTVTLMKRPAITRYGETATYFKAGSACDEAAVAEEIVSHFEKTRGMLTKLRRKLGG